MAPRNVAIASEFTLATIIARNHRQCFSEGALLFATLAKAAPRKLFIALQLALTTAVASTHELASLSHVPVPLVVCS